MFGPDGLYGLGAVAGRDSAGMPDSIQHDDLHAAERLGARWSAAEPLAAAVAGFFAVRAELPPPVTAPTVREFAT